MGLSPEEQTSWALAFRSTAWAWRSADARGTASIMPLAHAIEDEPSKRNDLVVVS